MVVRIHRGQSPFTYKTHDSSPDAHHPVHARVVLSPDRIPHRAGPAARSSRGCGPLGRRAGAHRANPAIGCGLRTVSRPARRSRPARQAGVRRVRRLDGCGTPPPHEPGRGVSHLLLDQADRQRSRHAAVRARQAAPRRPGLEIHSRVRGRESLRRRRRRDAGAARSRAGLNNPHWTLAQLSDSLAHLPLAFSPGSRWNYGYSIDVLARVLEVVSGMPFDPYLDSALLRPLGMSMTAFHVTPAMEGHVTTAYMRGPDGKLQATVPAIAPEF